MKTNIAIIDLYNNVPNEGMRCIKTIAGQFLAQKGVKGNYEVFNARAENQLPNINEYDLYISTGGPGSPLLTGENWENEYRKFIDGIFEYNKNNEQKKYLFAICHSFQILVQHLNLATVNKRKSTSFGVMPVHKVGDGFNEPIFEGLEDPFYAVDSRDFQVIEPKMDQFEALDSKILCLEKERPTVPLERAIMAIRFSEEVIGTQFHPEADAEGMQRYFEKPEKQKNVIDEYGIEKYETMLEQLEDPDKIKLTESIILPRFLNLSANKIEKVKKQLA